MTEQELQVQVFEFLRLALPPEAVAFAVPNGDRRMTTMPGALSGVPDICIIYKQRAVFIELKTIKGAVRLNQRHVHDRLTLAGALVAVCRSIDDVQSFLQQIIPLRARAA